MIEEPYTLGKIGEIAEKLEDIRDFIHEKFVLFPIDQIPLISEAIVNSNKNFLKIYFTLGYFGVKNQLEENFKGDLIEQMNNFMQWSRIEIRNHIQIMKLLNLGQFSVQNNEIREAMNCNAEVLKLDPNNRIALIAMAGLFKALGDMNQSNRYLERYQYIKAHPVKESISRNPKEEFESIINKLEKGQNVIERTKNRDTYKKICSEPYGILDIIMDSIAFIGNGFKVKNSGTTIGELRIIINDLLFFLSEWLTYISGAVYYIMRHSY
ncbi:MAG: type IV pilus biogenesis/stability protein PilW, partial [Candidatus Thorarchaeota archaeon]